jgi:mono/diheme cytochrome c family protein
MTREQWSKNVATMVQRGAKITDAEFVQVVDYLAQQFPPGQTTPESGGSARVVAGAPPPSPSAPRRAAVGMGWGPNDKHVVDTAAADRGRAVYIAECITCHGPKARGANANVAENQKGSDLVRSVTVLHDRYANTVGPFLKKGHPTQSGNPSANFTEEQVSDLSHFLHQRVNDTLRSGPYSEVLNVLTGNAKEGAVYFNGAGKCNTCHSPKGDLAGISTKYDPPSLQQRFLFPRTMGFGRRSAATPSKPVMVTVTPPSGQSVSGVLDKIDDFNVSLRDSEGEYHSWKRTPGLKVEKNDPYAAHIELLDQYTDKNIHDVVAYLETLK